MPLGADQGHSGAKQSRARQGASPPPVSSGSLDGRSEGVTRVLLLISGAQASAEYILLSGTQIHLIKGMFPAVPPWQLEMTYRLQLPWLPTTNDDFQLPWDMQSWQTRANSWKGAHATVPYPPLTQTCTTAPAVNCSEASAAVPLRSRERMCRQGAGTAQNHNKFICRLPRPGLHLSHFQSITTFVGSAKIT